MTFSLAARTACLAAFTLACTGGALEGQVPPSKAQRILTPEGSYALRLGATVAGASDAVSRVWPGFWPQDQGFALKPLGDGALLVSSRAPDSADARLLREGVPPELQNRAFYVQAEQPLVSGGFELDYRVGQLVVPMVQLLGADVPDRDINNLAYLYHEAFHAFQRDAFDPVGGAPALEEPFLESRYVADPEFLARLESERDMLRAALRAEGDGWRSFARLYLASRDGRLLHTGAAVATAEDQVMRKEGTAHFVGWAAALLAERKDVGSLPVVLESHLRDPILRRMTNPADIFRRTLYSTGAATAYLLERAGVDWRVEVQQGRSLAEALRREVGGAIQGGQQPSVLTEELDFRQHLRFYEALVASWSVIDVPDDSYGSRIVVEGFQLGKSETRGEVGRPAAGVQVTAKEGGYGAEGPGYLLEVSGYVVVIDGRLGAPVHTIYVPDGLIDGLPYPEEVPVDRDGFDLDVPGVRISISDRVTVLREGRVVHLRVGSP